MTGPKVLVLGAGVAGTIVANRLVRSGEAVDVTVVDEYEDHIHQHGLVRVALGDAAPESIRRKERSLLDRRVGLVTGKVSALDRDRRRVRLETGDERPYDALVIATGAHPNPRAIPGFREAAYHFHCRNRAPQVAVAVSGFKGGRIVVGAASLPYKCPPSIVEFALLLEERLRSDGRRARTEIRFIYPVAGVQPLPAVSRAVEPLLRERGISIDSPFPVASIDPAARTVSAADGRSLPYDLLVLVPPHQGERFLVEAGLAGPGGYVPVDPGTLRAAPRIYALGDAALVGRPGEPAVPKSGAAAKRQAAAVAANVLADLLGADAIARYDGGATCFADTGGGRAIRVDLRYGEPPCVYPPRRIHSWMLAAMGRLYFPMIARG